MIVLDASVLVAHLSSRDPHGDRALDVLETEEELALHPLTLAELLVRPARDGREQLVLDAIEALGVGILETPPGQAEELARLRARTGLKLPDCCVLAAARVQGARLATFDQRLAAAARDLDVEVVSA